MKVLLIDVNCKNSSTGKIVYDLYSHINSNANGDEAAICYGRGPKIKEKNIYKFGLDWETYLHAFLTRITGYTACFSFFSTRRLLRRIKKFKPDLVHIHELHAYFVNIKPLVNFLKKNHIKTVMTLHCEFAYTGKCGYPVECQQWKTECKNCPHLKGYVSTLWFDRTHHMFVQKKKLFADFNELVVVTPSQWLASRAKESFLNNHLIKVIHNGVDTSIFYPRDSKGLREELGINPDEKIVLALAPHLMSEVKGGYHVLQIAKLLEDKKIRFVLVGVDNVEVINEANVIAKGRINNKNILADYYSLADEFLICSGSENYPTTCLEAQACGTPVFGFDTGGIKETCLFKDNISKYADCADLAIKIIEGSRKTNESTRRISELAKDKLSNVASCKEYYELYKIHGETKLL